jgi:hypothetical protein
MVVLLAVTAFWIVAPTAGAQVCPGTTVRSDLLRPLGIAQSNLGNLLISETGTMAPHSGRISIVDALGDRRTLLDGLPSGINDVNEPSGPAGVAIRGRTLYVLIGIGDSVLPGPIPTTHLPNANVSSPLFSSVLAIHFSENVEKTTAGFTLAPGDHQRLANGERVMLSNGGGDTVTIELVANFPDYVPNPLPGFPQIVRGSNPFGVLVNANHLYVTDGGRNLLWQVDLATGDFASLAEFPTVPTPIPGFGPVVEAVPTGLAMVDGDLLVALFSGVPFAPGTSRIVRVDVRSGAQSIFAGGLKTAIAVLEMRQGRDVDYLLLQHSSGPAPFFAGPGLVMHVESEGATPMVVADCMTRPTAMVLNEKTRTLLITELPTGRLVALQLGP